MIGQVSQLVSRCMSYKTKRITNHHHQQKSYGIQSPSESEPSCIFCLKLIHGEHLTYSNRIK
jgi:hypothetical protein